MSMAAPVTIRAADAGSGASALGSVDGPAVSVPERKRAGEQL
jgi:hypothetical protein